MIVDDVQIWALRELAARGLLLHKSNLKHSYPHCWRCHKGLMFRATKQWFCDLTHQQLKERSLAAIDTLYMLPESSNRLKATEGDGNGVCPSTSMGSQFLHCYAYHATMCIVPKFY
jgi:valyl-tRNA synthetase